MNFFIGKIFWTTKTTLQSEPDSMLAKMFSGEFAPGTKDEQGAYLLDQNPKYFEPILDYLRTRELINDPNVSISTCNKKLSYLLAQKYFTFIFLAPMCQF